MLPNSKVKKTSLALALAGALLGVACGDANDALPGYDCAAESLPGEYIRQTGGSYSPDDVDPRPGGIALEDGGVVQATFSFWKQDVHSVPFEPPAHIVCEALLMREADEASAFVAMLLPGEDVLASTTISWPTGANFVVQERPIPQVPSARLFVSTEQGGEGRSIVSLYQAQGNVVLAVHAGTTGKEIAPGELIPALLSIAASDD